MNALGNRTAKLVREQDKEMQRFERTQKGHDIRLGFFGYDVMCWCEIHNPRSFGTPSRMVKKCTRAKTEFLAKYLGLQVLAEGNVGRMPT